LPRIDLARLNYAGLRDRKAKQFVLPLSIDDQDRI
jgi:hypothetical protein